MIDPKLKALLDLAAWSEGTSTHPWTKNDGYDVVVTGDTALGEKGLEIFTDYTNHPFAYGRPAKRISPTLTSTASGRYQLLLRFWRDYQTMLGINDFSPASQDAIALRQLRERHADLMIMGGDVAEAINACSTIWASFPGKYSQGNGPKTMDVLLAKYAELLTAATAAQTETGATA